MPGPRKTFSTFSHRGAAAKISVHVWRGGRVVRRRLRRAKPPLRTSASDSDSRIEDGIDDVDEDVDEHETRCDDQYHALHNREISIVNRVHRQITDAGECENRFNNSRTAKQIAKLDADCGNEWNE